MIRYYKNNQEKWGWVKSIWNFFFLKNKTLKSNNFLKKTYNYLKLLVNPQEIFHKTYPDIQTLYLNQVILTNFQNLSYRHLKYNL